MPDLERKDYLLVYDHGGSLVQAFEPYVSEGKGGAVYHRGFRRVSLSAVPKSDD